MLAAGGASVELLRTAEAPAALDSLVMRITHTVSRFDFPCAIWSSGWFAQICFSRRLKRDSHRLSSQRCICNEFPGCHVEVSAFRKVLACMLENALISSIDAIGTLRRCLGHHGDVHTTRCRSPSQVWNTIASKAHDLPGVLCVSYPPHDRIHGTTSLRTPKITMFAKVEILLLASS